MFCILRVYYGIYVCICVFLCVYTRMSESDHIFVTPEVALYLFAALLRASDDMSCIYDATFMSYDIYVVDCI